VDRTTRGPAVFTAETWPHIRELEVVELMNATGLSGYYYYYYYLQIRQGNRTPHARHWDSLRNLINDRTSGLVAYARRSGCILARSSSLTERGRVV
jgi:hypothetical protein